MGDCGEHSILQSVSLLPEGVEVGKLSVIDTCEVRPAGTSVEGLVWLLWR